MLSIKASRAAVGHSRLCDAQKLREDLHEFLANRIAEKHFVLDSPQEGFVAEALGLKVGGENQESPERHFHFSACVEAERSPRGPARKPLLIERRQSGEGSGFQPAAQGCRF